MDIANFFTHAHGRVAKTILDTLKSVAIVTHFADFARFCWLFRGLLLKTAGLERRERECKILNNYCNAEMTDQVKHL